MSVCNNYLHHGFCQTHQTLLVSKRISVYDHRNTPICCTGSVCVCVAVCVIYQLVSCLLGGGVCVSCSSMFYHQINMLSTDWWHHTPAVTSQMCMSWPVSSMYSVLSSWLFFVCLSVQHGGFISKVSEARMQSGLHDFSLLSDQIGKSAFTAAVFSYLSPETLTFCARRLLFSAVVFAAH